MENIIKEKTMSFALRMNVQTPHSQLPYFSNSPFTIHHLDKFIIYHTQFNICEATDLKDEFHSPYAYCGNNSVMFLDPDGCESKVRDNCTPTSPIDLNLKLNLLNAVKKLETDKARSIEQGCFSEYEWVQGYDNNKNPKVAEINNKVFQKIISVTAGVIGQLWASKKVTGALTALENSDDLVNSTKSGSLKTMGGTVTLIVAEGGINAYLLKGLQTANYVCSALVPATLKGIAVGYIIMIPYTLLLINQNIMHGETHGNHYQERNKYI